MFYFNKDTLHQATPELKKNQVKYISVFSNTILKQAQRQPMEIPSHRWRETLLNENPFTSTLSQLGFYSLNEINTSLCEYYTEVSDVLVKSEISSDWN